VHTAGYNNKFNNMTSVT